MHSQLLVDYAVLLHVLCSSQGHYFAAHAMRGGYFLFAQSQSTAFVGDEVSREQDNDMHLWSLVHRVSCTASIKVFILHVYPKGRG